MRQRLLGLTRLNSQKTLNRCYSTKNNDVYAPPPLRIHTKFRKIAFGFTGGAILGGIYGLYRFYDNLSQPTIINTSDTRPTFLLDSAPPVPPSKIVIVLLSVMYQP